jgi:nicotinamidase-related amidase
MMDALLLIDLQVDSLAENGRMPISQGMVTRVLRASEAARREARQRGWAIVAVGNEFSRWDFPLNLVKGPGAVNGAQGAAWDPRTSRDWDAYFAKNSRNSFANPALDRWLRERGVTRVHLAGAMAGGCVAESAKGALKRGYQVLLIPNGIGARSERSWAASLRQLGRTGCTISEVADQPMEWFRREELPAAGGFVGRRAIPVQAAAKMLHFGWGHSRRG